MGTEKENFSPPKSCEELQKKNLVTADHVSNIMEEFGRNQDLIVHLFNTSTGQKVKKQYNEEIRKFALTLHFFSPKAYNYVRNQFNNCLPHSKTLSKWYSVVDAEPGITQEALGMLKIKCAKSTKKKLSALLYLMRFQFAKK